MKHYSRKFLNSTEGTAFIEVNARQGVDWVDSTVTLSDCSRQVSLDFSFSKRKSKREKLKKIALLISELQALEAFMKEQDVPQS